MRPGLRGEQGSDHTGLDVPDIQRAYQALSDRGAVMRSKPRIAGKRALGDQYGGFQWNRVEPMEPKPAAK
jgi:hypothetical protein